MRACIFCGAGGLTKEDAWPLWLMRRFPSSTGVVVNAERAGLPSAEWRQASPFAKVRFVCAPCNNGWMSRLESAAKPIVESLLEDAATNLSLDDQLTLGRWALKCAMVFEALRGPRQWFYSPAERAELAAGGIPSGYTNAWYGRCGDLPGVYCLASDMSDRPDPSTSSANGYLTTMAFGSVAVQVVTIRLSPPEFRPNRITTDLRPGPWDKLLLRVWPPAQEARWPPQMTFDGELGVESLSLRYRPVGSVASAV